MNNIGEDEQHICHIVRNLPSKNQGIGQINHISAPGSKYHPLLSNDSPSKTRYFPKKTGSND